MPYNPVPGSVLALDMASVTGWAWGAPRRAPLHGVYNLPRPGISLGAHYAAFTDALSDLLTIHQPEMIVMEAAMVAGSGSALTTETALGRVGIVYLLGYRYEIEVEKVASQTVRKAVLGHGRPDDPKAAVMAWARSKGLRPSTDDAADALATLAWKMGPGWVKHLTPEAVG